MVIAAFSRLIGLEKSVYLPKKAPWPRGFRWGRPRRSRLATGGDNYGTWPNVAHEQHNQYNSVDSRKLQHEKRFQDTPRKHKKKQEQRTVKGPRAKRENSPPNSTTYTPQLFNSHTAASCEHSNNSEKKNVLFHSLFFPSHVSSLPFLLLLPPSKSYLKSGVTYNNKLFTPLPTTVRALRFDREEGSALYSLVDWRRIVVSTHAVIGTLDSYSSVVRETKIPHGEPNP